MKGRLIFTLTLLLGVAGFLTTGFAQTYAHHETLNEGTGLARALAFSPNGALLASGGGSDVYLHDPGTGMLELTLPGHTAAVTVVAFSPDGSMLASASGDRTIRLWNPLTGRLIRTLRGHTNQIYAMAFSPTGQLASGGRDNTVRLWNTQTGTNRIIGRHGGWVLSVAFSRTGLLASSGRDNTIRIWNATTGAPLRSLNGHTNFVTSVAFTATGDTLVSGSRDNSIRIWNAATGGAALQTLPGHTNWVNSVAVFARDASDTIASAGADETVRLWNLQTGQPIATLDEHTDLVRVVAFSRNGQHLASGSGDGTVQVYQRSGTGIVAHPGTGGGDGTVQPTNNGWLATIVPTVGGQKVEDTTGNSPIAVETNTKIPLTVSVTRNGRRVRTKAVLFSVEGSGGPFTISGPNGENISKANTENGQVSVTLTLGANEGTFKFIVKAEGEFEDEDDLPIGELSFTATEGPGADAESLEVDYPKTLAPRLGNGNGRFTLTVTVKTPAGKAKSNIAIDVDWRSGPQIEGIPTEWPRTNAEGVLELPLRLKDSSDGTLKFRATVIGSRKELTQTHSITVKQTLAKVVLSSIPSQIDSGDSVSVTATAYSENGTPVRKASITFSESASELRFTSTSGTTGSSGQVSTTLETKGSSDGKWEKVGESDAYYDPEESFSVSVSASHEGTRKSDSDSVAVVPVKKRGTDDFEVVSKAAGRDCGFLKIVWCRKSQKRWSDYASFPSTVLYIVDVDGEMSWGDALLGATASINGESIDGTTVDVWGTIETHWHNPNNYTVTVEAEYAATASSFGGTPAAPALDPQFRPEADLLSTFWQDLSQVPEKTALLPNYPNPFNPETWIPYRLAESAEVTLSIYSLNGNRVRTLALGHQPAGFYESRSRAAYWDGRNAIGERVASGVYFYTLTAGDFAATGKMLILK